MNEEKNYSTIESSYKPHSYRKARYAHNTGDADLPLPTVDEAANDEKPAT